MKYPPRYVVHVVIAFLLVGVATVWIEHSAFDLAIANLFYLGEGRWLIDKSNWLFDGLFYTVPKRLLIVFELYVIAAWFWRYKTNNHQNPPKIFRPVASLSVRELGYLAMTMLFVPTVVASLKTITHTPCPVSLELFGGVLPYLPLMENIQMAFGKKCFPAAHASSGFALYALCFVPSFWRYRRQMAMGVTLLAWLMGGYKMAIGDHFFSHTLVSMCLAWGICAAMASLFFKNNPQNHS